MKTPDEFAQAMIERKTDPTKISKPTPWDTTGRPVGIIMCVVGLLGIGYSLLTVDSAQHYERDIFLLGATTFLSPYFTLVGVTWVILGERGAKVLGPAYAPSRVGKALYGAYLIASIACGVALRHYLMSLGYTFK